MIKFKSLKNRIWVLISIGTITAMIITSILTCIMYEVSLRHVFSINILERVAIVLSDNKYMIIVIIITGFIVAKIIADYISKPLKRLEDYTVKISKRQWVENMEVESEDEIGSLTHAMNEMQKQLKRSHEEEKLFLQSISHDLKTPVMVIMSHAQAIIDGMYLDSVEQTAEVIKNESIRLDKKIKRILYLNSLEYLLDNNNNIEEINLNDIVMDIARKFKILDEKLKWTISGNDIFLKGNEDNIAVCIENIVENALRYAKKEIRISLYEEDKYYIVEIFNDGIKINEEELEKIFNNFYKGRNGKFGLGLAISKKIANHYGGTIIANNEINGVTFTIKFLKKK